MAKRFRGVEVKNLKDVLFALKYLGRNSEDIVKNESKQAADNILRESKKAAPRKTGKLANSGFKNEKEAGFVWQVGYRASYAPLVEYGDSNTPARPFLHPAFERERHQYVRRLKKRIKKGK